jgi:hypothetical protein
MHEGYIELHTECSRRAYTGEGYDDGIGYDDLKKMRDRALDAIHKEERRQQAQYTLGMRDKPPKSIYDGP